MKRVNIISYLVKSYIPAKVENYSKNTNRNIINGFSKYSMNKLKKLKHLVNKYKID